MTLTPAGLQLLKSLEGCSLEAYPDPPGGSSWSIGYGLALNSGLLVRRLLNSYGEGCAYGGCPFSGVMPCLRG